MKLILLTITIISVSCGTEVMADPKQKIINQEVEKSVVFSPIRDSGFYCF
jgi:hypothetical protein